MPMFSCSKRRRSRAWSSSRAIRSGQNEASSFSVVSVGAFPVSPAVREFSLIFSETRLVGVLAEVDLERVRRAGEHVDVRAGAEDLVVAAGDDARLYRWVLE